MSIEGHLQNRPLKQCTDETNGTVEILVKKMTIVNECTKKLPFPSSDIDSTQEDIKAKYRFLDIRWNQELRKALLERSRLTLKARNWLQSRNFIDIDTPALFKHTKEGAREFTVPYRRNSKYKYALSQSPQQYKQLLISGGISRYYQFAKCFRDEDHRSDRQSEFTQLDLELAFVDEKDIMELINGLILELLPDLPPIEVMTFQEAISRYGTDKPDTRHKNSISTVERTGERTIEFFDGPLTHTSFTKGPQDHVLLRCNDNGEVTTIFGDDNIQIPSHVLIAPKEKTRYVLVRDSRYLSGITPLGTCRNESQAGKETKNDSMLWVTNFPMFNTEMEPSHHPFTAPCEWNLNDPLSMNAKHYDLVFNGIEIGGGSIRIHDFKAQKLIFEKILKLSQKATSDFKHLLDALSMGCPPHGGFAIGWDRFLMIVLKKNTVRDVIAFPKNSQGKDLCVGSPSEMVDHMRGENRSSIQDL